MLKHSDEAGDFVGVCRSDFDLCWGTVDNTADELGGNDLSGTTDEASDDRSCCSVTAGDAQSRCDGKSRKAGRGGVMEGGQARTFGRFSGDMPESCLKFTL